MAWKKILIVTLALGVAPVTGCKKKSNTTEQTQSPPGTGDTTTTTGTGANPHQPNPVNAQSASPMGTEAAGVGAANNAMGDGGVGSAAGSAGSAKR